jgi:large subunit ribosomal protein L17
MAYRKLNRATDQRMAILRNLTTALLWNGKIVTTETRAKEVRSMAEKLITLAAKEYKNTVEVTKTIKNKDGKAEQKTFKNDAPSKLHARRLIMTQLYDITDAKKDSETGAEYKDRINNGPKHPVVEKLFNEVAPKYEGRQGGYTRIIKMGPRRGDAAEMVILELV